MAKSPIERGLNRYDAKYAIVSSAPPDWRSFAGITNQLKGEYAYDWGYHFFADESMKVHVAGDMIFPIRGFIKFDMIFHYLPKYEWVVWIDADCLLTNKRIRLESFIAEAERAGKEFIIGYDHNGLHSSVLFVKRTQRMLDFIWTCNNTGRNLFISHAWHEMEAIRYFLGTPPYAGAEMYIHAKRLCPILRRLYDQWINPGVAEQYGWAPGDWIMSLTAMSVEDRLKFCVQYADPQYHYEKPAVDFEDMHK